MDCSSLLCQIMHLKDKGLGGMQQRLLVRGGCDAVIVPPLFAAFRAIEEIVVIVASAFVIADGPPPFLNSCYLRSVISF